MPTNPTDPSAIVIPFGKHKGATVAELLATDPQYADWLMAQGWLAERFAELHSAIQTRGAGADDTPEHNAIQGRFLDDAFRKAFLLAVYQPDGIDRWRRRAQEQYAREKARELKLTDLRASLDLSRQTLRNELEAKWPPYWLYEHKKTVDDPEQKQNWEARRQEKIAKYRTEIPVIETKVAYAEAEVSRVVAPPIVTAVRFEVRGVDVVLAWGFGYAEQGYDGYSGQLGIEIKPSVGDDYPTIMRQMQRLGAGRLLVDKYTGRALSFDAVREMFRANDITVVTVREVEAEIANARVLLT